MQLTKNFSLEEMTRSDYAMRHKINNDAPPDVVSALKLLCEAVLQPLRDAIGVPIIVTSGYRSPMVNSGIGSSDTSQHPRGEAGDVRAVGMTSRELFDKIVSLELPYDQVIDEFESWVHVSHIEKRVNRRMKLITIHDDEGKVIYKLS